VGQMSTLLKVGQMSVGQTSVGQMSVAEKSRHHKTYIDFSKNHHCLKISTKLTL
jgi:hypothetical protein